MTTVLLATATLALVPAAAGAQAQAVPVLRDYDLPAGPLGATLNRIAREAGLALTVDAGLVGNREAAPVRGRYDAAQALRRALANSGLDLLPTDAGGYTVRAGSPVTPAASGTGAAAATLSEVRVSAERENAWGPVDGYIARRSASGTKTDTPIVETPQSISVVTAEQIESQQPANLVDAFAYTAGVMRSEGADRTTDSFVIRGFQAGAGTGSLYRDGSKFMVNSYDGQQELYGLERAEVLKGAASLLYGTAAPGGVINTVTKRPTAEPLRELGIELGNHGRRRVKGDFGGKLDDDGTLTYRLTGLLRESKTFIDFVPDDRQFLSGSIKWQPNAATSLTLQAEYLRSRTDYVYGLPASGTILENPFGRIPASRYIGTPGRDRYHGANTSVGYLFEHAFNGQLKLRHSAHAFRSDVKFPSTDTEGLAPDNFSSQYHSAQDRTDFSRAYTTDTSLEFRFGTGAVEHTLLAGIDTTYQYHTTRRANRDIDTPLNYYAPNYAYTLSTAVPFTYYPDTSGNDTGLYLQDQMKIDKRWVVVLGARRDRSSDRQVPVDGVTQNSKEKTSATTARAGLVYLADNGLAPFVSFSQSFQPQSGIDRLGSRFKPTQGEQYEAGIRYQPAGSDTLLSAAVYQLTQQNVLSTDPVDTQFSVQTGEVRSRGFEFEARTRVGKSVNLIAAYAYTDARVTADNTAANVGKRRGNVPYNTFSAWGEYDFGAAGVPGLKAGMGVRYVGSSTGLYVSGKVPSYTVYDAMLSYDTGNWRYALNLSNLADKSHIASCTYGCFYGERRKAVASATYRW
ncbi:TonB-dependent siderophore receptor [Variovorax sp. efr-133-TYG-130]|uniref:TonB-dependent siderophore receptor n=1 Tax=Variovorax sp. efr-133-TYG-130 TaxID=3040327 RepID=UPI002557A86A|nr:TonB-dependent siderophore receptor [Variovorax sp. efr-133-TYG-130]